MNAKCAYHPDRIARGACADCAAPLCTECQSSVAGKTLCPRCADSLRAQPAAPAASPPPSPVSASPSPVSAAPPVSVPGPVTAGPAEPTSTPVPIPSPIVKEPPPPSRYLVGIVLAAVVGAIGALIWEKIAFHTEHEWPWTFIFIGIAVGLAVSFGSGPRFGVLPAILGGLITFGALMFGHYLLADDMNRKLYEEFAKVFNEKLVKAAATHGGQAPKLLPPHHISFQMFKETLSGYPGMHWVYVGIGVLIGFILPLKQPQTS